MLLHSDRFRYPVYSPPSCAIDTVRDWGDGWLTACDDAEHVLSQPFSVAALPIFFDKPGHWGYNAVATALDLSRFDLVLFSDPEYSSLNEIRSWLPVRHYLLAYGGLRSDETANPDREVYRAYYIRDFFEQNQFLPNHADSKPFLFDALLGARRAHRDFVIQALGRSGLLERSIATYRAGFPGEVTDSVGRLVHDLFQSPVPHPYVSPNLDPAWEVAAEVRNYHSRISPVKIYQRTWFSIVCETLHTGDHFFLSEKTIKAMYNRRIFVLFGARGYLENLRSHGFRTFDCMINESYDQEPQDLRRWQQAMHTVWQLAWFEQPRTLYQDHQWLLTENQNCLKSLEQKRREDLYTIMRRAVPADHWYTV